MRYDAIVVGASFAGLAVASRLKGNILLIDRRDIGVRQTSACGTLLNVPEALGTTDGVLQVYQKGFMHTPAMTIDYDLPYPFCALDYGRFCQGLAKRVEADFLKATVQGLRDGRVATDRGEVEASCFVDASGWRAALAGTVDTDLVDSSKLSFGVETEIPLRGTGLYFWVDPSLVGHGVGWLFPCGRYSRAGIASYQGSAGVKEGLATFLRRLGVESDGSHGGFLPWRLRKPVVENIFVVGDAAGQCLPLTGEGIRPARYFGMKCGDLVQGVIQGELGLQDALRLYRGQLDRYRKYYAFLEILQGRLRRIPPPRLLRMLLFFGLRPVWHMLLNSYENVAAPRKVNANPVRCSARETQR